MPRRMTLYVSDQDEPVIAEAKAKGLSLSALLIKSIRAELDIQRPDAVFDKELLCLAELRHFGLQAGLLYKTENDWDVSFTCALAEVALGDEAALKTFRSELAALRKFASPKYILSPLQVVAWLRKQIADGGYVNLAYDKRDCKTGECEDCGLSAWKHIRVAADSLFGETENAIKHYCYECYAETEYFKPGKEAFDAGEQTLSDIINKLKDRVKEVEGIVWP